MQSIIFNIVLFLLLPGFTISQKSVKVNPVIFDSDMGPDYDDVGAMPCYMLMPTVVILRYWPLPVPIMKVGRVFNVFNTYFHRPSIPIGVPKEHGMNIRDRQHWSDTLLANYIHIIKKNGEVPEAVEVYRKVLAAQADKSVIVITTGFLTNLAALLQSGPDKYSNLNGSELVNKKVKQLVSMAGRFPSGSEYNVRIDSNASQFLFANWPTPILLSGFEIGWKIRTGLPLIHNDKIQKSPVKDVFRISIPLDPNDIKGRPSWDETAVLVAAKGYESFYNIEKGTIIINKDGSNRWSAEGGNHAYLVVPSEMVELM
jgi:inosine-uridine nucleoside N-ribohydrolase